MTMTNNNTTAIEFAAVHLGAKTVVLMKDPPEPRTEMSAAPAPNADTMFWARCTTDSGESVVTRNAEAVRQFICDDISGLSQPQVSSLATIFCYLLKLGHAVGGALCSLQRAAASFGLDVESVAPRLLNDRLVFFANVSSPDDLTGLLYEYHYDLCTGEIQRKMCFEPDPAW